jgi:hypothetical protein
MYQASRTYFVYRLYHCYLTDVCLGSGVSALRVYMPLFQTWKAQEPLALGLADVRAPFQS